MKVGSLDHDGERERERAEHASTSHGCIYREREGERGAESDENGSEKAAAA